MNEQLHLSVYRPSDEVKGCVVIVHGMAEHRKRYKDFAMMLKKNGIAVITFDLPGHGDHTKEADLGWFGENDGWAHLLYSVNCVVKEAERLFPDRPCFLLGHSMGSMLARCYLQEHDDELDGLILTGAPCYQSAVSGGIMIGKALAKTKGQRSHSKIMDFLVTGTFLTSVKNPQTPFDWISYSRTNINNYIADPYCGFPFTIQGYIDELEGMTQMNDHTLYRCRKPELPILFAAGEDDPCTGGTGGLQNSQDVLRRAGYTNIGTRIYGEMRHEILNEEDRSQVYADLLSWINVHL